MLIFEGSQQTIIRPPVVQEKLLIWPQWDKKALTKRFTLQSVDLNSRRHWTSKLLSLIRIATPLFFRALLKQASWCLGGRSPQVLVVDLLFSFWVDYGRWTGHGIGSESFMLNSMGPSSLRMCLPVIPISLHNGFGGRRHWLGFFLYSWTGRFTTPHGGKRASLLQFLRRGWARPFSFAGSRFAIWLSMVKSCHFGGFCHEVGNNATLLYSSYIHSRNWPLGKLLRIGRRESNMRPWGLLLDFGRAILVPWSWMRSDLLAPNTWCIIDGQKNIDLHRVFIRIGSFLYQTSDYVLAFHWTLYWFCSVIDKTFFIFQEGVKSTCFLTYLAVSKPWCGSSV